MNEQGYMPVVDTIYGAMSLRETYRIVPERSNWKCRHEREFKKGYQSDLYAGISQECKIISRLFNICVRTIHNFCFTASTFLPMIRRPGKVLMGRGVTDNLQHVSEPG